MQEPSIVAGPQIILAILIAVSLLRGLGLTRRRPAVAWLHLAPMPRRQLPTAATTTIVVAFVLLTGTAGTPSSLAQAEPSLNLIRITDSGFQPALFTITAGQSVHWTNESSQPRSVVASGGLFARHARRRRGLQPGAGDGRRLCLTSSGGFSGTVRVSAPSGGLSGPPNDKANDHIPDLAVPSPDVSQTGAHPMFGGRTSRIHLTIGFSRDATVAQANAALSAAGVAVLGGIPALGLLIVAATDRPDFSGLIGSPGDPARRARASS